jgi:hypothetical protein
MTAERWPNGLGWDVGDAEIRDCVSFYRVFVPTTPEDGLARHKRLDIPKADANGLFGLDPEAMVAECDRTGTIHFDW